MSKVKPFLYMSGRGRGALVFYKQLYFHEAVPVTYEPTIPVAVLNTALLCIKKRIFDSQNGTILIKYKYKD